VKRFAADLVADLRHFRVFSTSGALFGASTLSERISNAVRAGHFNAMQEVIDGQDHESRGGA
jgi:hypothetical protein